MTDSTTQPVAEDAAKLFLNQLRGGTAEAHEALEAHPYSKDITADHVSRDTYIRYLSVMQGVVTGMEPLLHSRLGNAIPDIAQREKAAWLSEDLAALQGEIFPVPEFTSSLTHAADAQLLGAYYVLEGSTLGGRVLLKSLGPALGVSPEHGARYFAGYEAATGPMWQRFLSVLSEYALGNHCGAEIVEGAQIAFSDILRYFNQCQSYEAEGHRQS